MSNKQITITVAGPTHSGKTYVMEKIAGMLKEEGIDCSVECLDGDFGKFEEAKALSEQVATLKEVLENGGVDLVLREVQQHTESSLDPAILKTIEELRDLNKRLKAFAIRQAVHAIVVSGNLNLGEVLKKLPDTDVRIQRVVFQDRKFKLPETLEDKTLLVVWQIEGAATNLFTDLQLEGMPEIFPFLTKSVGYIGDPYTVTVIRDKFSKSTTKAPLKVWVRQMYGDPDEWMLSRLKSICKVDNDREFFNDWVTEELRLNVRLSFHSPSGKFGQRLDAITPKELLQLNPLRFKLLDKNLNVEFVKIMEHDDIYAAYEQLPLPPCFRYVDTVQVARNGSVLPEYWYQIVPE